MSKRDGKMYLALRLKTIVTTSMGLDLNARVDDMAGLMPVFWTKKAAREVYGRNVPLIQIAEADGE